MRASVRANVRGQCRVMNTLEDSITISWRLGERRELIGKYTISNIFSKSFALTYLDWLQLSYSL